jgi:hypothetical protein
MLDLRDRVLRSATLTAEWRCYLRYFVPSDQAGYNVAAQMTKLQAQGGMTVPDTVSDNDVITCTSCEYRYPRSEGSCVMCGTPAPSKRLQLCSAIPDEFSPAEEEAAPSSDSQQMPPNPGLTTLFAVVVVSIALTFFASFLYELRKPRPNKEFGPAPELTSRLGQPKSESTGPKQIVHYSARKAPLTIPVSLVTVQTIHGAKENDPGYLWNAVKRGSVQAEVALANLYLKGEAVAQSCEQAHILLLAASVKGSKLADDSLKNSYAERCR